MKRDTEMDFPETDEVKKKRLGQYPTPFWVADALVARHFGDLDRNDFVVEPACGPAGFLQAVPEHVAAVGIDIDARMVELARQNSCREIIHGDFLTVPLDIQPTAIIGNPPFNLDVMDGFLRRSHRLLPEGGRVGMILPAYAFQTAGRVAEYAEQWSMMQEMIPRNIYPGLSLPLVFALFSKDKRKVMVGFALYRELADLQQITKTYREIIGGIQSSVWKEAVMQALRSLGGNATLDRIYAEIEGRRPTKTQWWREQIRRTLRRYEQLFKANGGGSYTLVEENAIQPLLA